MRKDLLYVAFILLVMLIAGFANVIGNKKSYEIGYENGIKHMIDDQESKCDSTILSNTVFSDTVVTVIYFGDTLKFYVSEKE